MPKNNRSAAEWREIIPHNLSIAEWCEVNNLSRSMFYKLDRQGLAPLTIKIGRKRLITETDSEEWLEKMDRKARSIGQQ